MKLWSGIITENLQASKDFYVGVFDCTVIYDSDWFALLQLGDSQLGFMLPNLETQAHLFQNAFLGQGIWLAIDVDDAKVEYERIQTMGIPIEVELRDEPWGDRHFAIVDPNGIGIDIVQRIEGPPA